MYLCEKLNIGKVGKYLYVWSDNDMDESNWRGVVISSRL